VAELAARLADTESELERLGARCQDAFEAVNARITNALRRKAREDAPSETNGDEEAPQPPPKRFAPTAHLSARFRRF
jgi:hypothetical protein